MLFYILLFCCSCNSIFQISFCKKRLWTPGKGRFIKCLFIVIVIIIVVVVIVMTMIIKWSASSFNASDGGLTYNNDNNFIHNFQLRTYLNTQKQ